MTDEIADAAEFTFRTPDEASALRCSEALSAYGFAQVYAYCPIDGDWLVTAIDEGPYPYGKVGERAVDEVGHQAAEAVRAFRAYFIGGGTVALGPPMPPARTGIRVQYENPGSRPPVPLVTIGTPPPMVVLPLAPDRVVAGKPDLSGLDDISWSELVRQPPIAS